MHRTFETIPTIVLKMENGSLDTLKNVIEELVRKNKKIGDLILINKYGKIFELEKTQLIDGRYIKKIRGKL